MVWPEIVRRRERPAEVLTQKDDLDAAPRCIATPLTRDVDHWARLCPRRSHRALATALLYLGNTDEAEEHYRTALVAYRASLGLDHPKVAETINNLGAVHYFGGDSAGAAGFYREALPLYRKLFGESHPEVAMILNNLGRIELERGAIDAALPLLEESVEMDRSLGRRPRRFRIRAPEP
jgi:tetratricopeptide (TPR) repeat protein